MNGFSELKEEKMGFIQQILSHFTLNITKPEYKVPICEKCYNCFT